MLPLILTVLAALCTSTLSLPNPPTPTLSPVSTPHPHPQPQAQSKSSHPTHPTGVSVQTGYEGYLVPNTPHEDEDDFLSGLGSLAAFASSLFNGEPSLLSLLGLDDEQPKTGEPHKVKLIGAHGKPVIIPVPDFLTKLKPKFSKLSKFDKFAHNPKKALVVKLLTKAILGILAVATVFLLTGGVAAAVCAFTPLCTISFLARENFRGLMSTDTLSDFAQFVVESVAKYSDLQLDTTPVEKL